MIKMFFDRVYEIEEAERITGLKYIDFPDDVFEMLSREFNLNRDLDFIKYLREIDQCDIPLDNVARDLITGATHSFDKVSTGVRVLWLMSKFPQRFLYPTQWLGENCYQSMFEIGKKFDCYVYEDSNMFAQDGVEECSGEFLDFRTGETVLIDNDNGFDYVMSKGY